MACPHKQIGREHGAQVHWSGCSGRSTRTKEVSFQRSLPTDERTLPSPPSTRLAPQRRGERTTSAGVDYSPYNPGRRPFCPATESNHRRCFLPAYFRRPDRKCSCSLPRELKTVPRLPFCPTPQRNVPHTNRSVHCPESRKLQEKQRYLERTHASDKSRSPAGW